MTLYEIATQYSSLKAFIEDHNDEAEVDPDYLLHLLKQIEGDLYDKIDQVARISIACWRLYAVEVRAGAAHIRRQH